MLTDDEKKVIREKLADPAHVGLRNAVEVILEDREAAATAAAVEAKKKTDEERKKNWPFGELFTGW